MGQFKAGKRVGPGALYYRNQDGTEHERKGIWIDNDLRGEVKHYFPAKNRTEIEFWNAEGFFIGDRDQNDLPHGQATMNFHPNEEGKKKFTGLWQHGVKNGFGVLTWKKGDFSISTPELPLLTMFKMNPDLKLNQDQEILLNLTLICFQTSNQRILL